jgi:hypothetical protein
VGLDKGTDEKRAQTCERVNAEVKRNGHAHQKGKSRKAGDNLRRGKRID